MASMDVIVKINTQLWGVGSWARTLVMDTHQYVVEEYGQSVLRFQPTAWHRRGAAPQIAEATRACMADREVARVLPPARTHHRVVRIIVMVEMFLAGTMTV